MYLFLKEAIFNFKQTGALFSSSKFLSKKITSFIPTPKKSQLIIELGPGNGVITKKILQSISKDSKLIVFELNTKFCKELSKINDSRLVIINDSATNISDLNISKKAACVISSLPLASINNEVKTLIMDEVNRNLEENGQFIQYQYSLLDYSFLKNKFTDTKLAFTILNLPPSFIYVCKK